MDDEFLGHFAKKFRYHLLEIFTYTSNGKNGNDYPIDGLPTRISLKNGVYIIRIEVDPEVLSTCSPLRSKMQTGTKVFSLFSDLIQWLLFINTTVLRRSDETKTIKNSELKAHHELVDWLFQEAFHPSGSAPVLGIISPDALHQFGRGREFGLIQTILIKYLSFLQKPEKTCRAALLITRLYYGEVKPQIFKGLGRLNQVDFDLKINSLIADGIQFQINIGRASDVSKVQRQLENFAICDLENLPKSMKPGSHKVVYHVALGEKEKEILQHFNDAFSMTRPKSQDYPFWRKRLEAEDLPALLRSFNFDAVNRRIRGYVWIELKTGDLPRTDHIKTKLEFLIMNLKVCHSEFRKYINSRGIQTEFNIHKTFFQWIYNILINPGSSKLPIFGEFVLENHDQKNFILSKSHFHPAQLYLMHYFSDTRAHDRTVQVALTLIGYWYKNNKHDYFDKLFGNDQEYWNTVIYILEDKYNFDGCCSLRNFSIR
jgi:hypothetical protein